MAGRYFTVAQSPWNTPIPSGATVASNSSTLVTDLDRMLTSAPENTSWWINTDSDSAPIYEVRGSQTTKVPVTLVTSEGVPVTPNDAWVANGGDLSPWLAWQLAQGVPIPDGATPAAGTDKHMVIVDIETSEYWETWETDYGNVIADTWSCQYGGYTPDHQTNLGIFESPIWGATATSLPIAAGMIGYGEVVNGLIPHALQVILPDPLDAFVWPAQRNDGYADKVIPEGSIFRLKQDVDVSSLTAEAGGLATQTLQAIATAMQTYGCIVIDCSSPGNAVTFRADVNLTNTQFGDYPNNVLASLTASDFEFIDPSYRPPFTAIPSVPEVSTMNFKAT